MKAVIYARYSAGPRQTEQSIEGQVRACQGCAEQKGLEVTEIYADQHITGRSDARPEFQRLIADAKRKKFQAVIVYRTDRFARDKYDSVIYKRELKRNGVQIYYAAEPIPEGPEGIILEGLLESMAEYYSAELSQKVQRGMKETALKGLSNGGRIPMGYQSENKKLVINEKEAGWVREIFSLFINGEAVADIVKAMNAKGCPVKAHGIRTMLSNRKYIGEYKWKDVYLPGVMPAIIDSDVFAAAQEEKKKRQKRRKPRIEKYLLSGKLFCGECGSAMQGVSGTGKSGGTWYYYSCPKSRKKNCTMKNWPKDRLEDLVTDLTVRYILQEDTLRMISRKVADLMKEDGAYDNEKRELKKQLQQNKKAIANIIAVIETGSRALAARLRELEEEQIYLTNEISKLNGRRYSEDQVYFMLTKFLEDANPEKILKTFVAEVWLYNDHIETYYNLTNSKGSKAEFERSAFCSTTKVSSRTLLKITPCLAGLIREFD